MNYLKKYFIYLWENGKSKKVSSPQTLQSAFLSLKPGSVCVWQNTHCKDKKGKKKKSTQWRHSFLCVRLSQSFSIFFDEIKIPMAVDQRGANCIDSYHDPLTKLDRNKFKNFLWCEIWSYGARFSIFGGNHRKGKSKTLQIGRVTPWRLLERDQKHMGGGG